MIKVIMMLMMMMMVTLTYQGHRYRQARYDHILSGVVIIPSTIGAATHTEDPARFRHLIIDLEETIIMIIKINIIAINMIIIIIIIIIDIIIILIIIDIIIIIPFLTLVPSY